MKIKILLLALIVSGGIAGCPARSRSGRSPAKGRILGVSVQTMNNPFFVDLNEGLREVVEQHGDTLVLLDAQFNSLKQKNDASDLVHRGAAAIFLNPVDWEGVKGSLLQAKQKGIPCVVVDAPVRDRELVLCTVASDNVKAGRLAAQALVRARRPAKIAILQLSVNKACIDRVEGFRQELAQYPDMEIVDVQEGQGTTEGARPVMRDLIGRHPDLNALFAINDPSALGAISALESAGKLHAVAVVSVDGSADALEAVRSGKLLATAAQFPREIGVIAAEQAYKALEGKPVERTTNVRVELITRDNVASFLKRP